MSRVNLLTVVQSNKLYCSVLYRFRTLIYIVVRIIGWVKRIIGETSENNSNRLEKSIIHQGLRAIALGPLLEREKTLKPLLSRSNRICWFCGY